MTLPVWIKGWVPPNAYRVIDRARRGRSGLGQVYATWAQAKANATGYDSEHILEQVSRSSRQASQTAAPATFERDGVTLENEQPPFPLLACLLRAAASKGDGTLSVIDFGGSLGSSYRQCEPFLNSLKSVSWNVVEQPHFVERGRQIVETDHLKFFYKMSEAAQSAPPDVILFSSVLQYLDDPSGVIADAVNIAPRTIIIDRTPVTGEKAETFTIQYVPADIFKARLAFRAFGEGQIDTLLSGYRRIMTFDTVDPDMRAGTTMVRFQGALFERQHP